MRWALRWIGILWLALCVPLVGCDGGDAPTASSEAPAPTRTAEPTGSTAASSGAGANAVAEAAEIFSMRCVTCHGSSGGGDGPGSKGLHPAPRDFRDPVWQAEVSDDHIANIVMYGGAAVGRSPTMPGNPDLSGKPEVVAALVQYVRGLAEGQ